VRFAEPPQSVAPGQAVVFYDGDVVLGGGTLASTRRPAVTLPLRPTG
jgi:tRNA-uridine 2-sulfurtransferase